jgi:hypothetical protein
MKRRVKMTDRIKWAEQLQEKSLELLEFTLDMKEEGEDSGWEWFYIMSLLADQVVITTKGNSSKVTLNEERKNKFNSVYNEFLQAYLNGKQGGLDCLDGNEKEKVRELVAAMKVVRKSMPVRRTSDFLGGLDAEEISESGPPCMVGSVPFLDVDVLVTLPRGSFEAVRRKVESHLKDELPRGRTCRVIIGKEGLKLFMRNEGDTNLVKTAVNEILQPYVTPDTPLIY